MFAVAAATVRAMPSERPYLREDYQRERTSVLIWLISAIIAGFVLQLIVGSPWFRGSHAFTSSFALSIPGVQDWRIWTLLTHSFLHSTGFIFHVIGNVIALYFLGRELLPMLGPRRFLGLYATATLVGALAWTAVHWRFGGGETLIGATAAVDALFIVFACFFPNKELNFLLFFLFPVTLKPKHIAYALAAFDLCVLLFAEIPGALLPFNIAIASSAHLGGMAVGFLYYRFVHDARWFLKSGPSETELPRWMKRGKKAVVIPPAEQVSAETPEDIRAEVDRILDKINSHGFGALTPDEKRMLDEAKDLLSRP